MSVLIKGMEMPESCASCEWSYYVGNGRAMCKKVRMTDKTDIMTKRRADFCPLVEVPTPHGNLIDRDAPHLKGALKGIREAETQIYGRDSWGFANKSMSVIYDAPTIIKAEGNEE